MEWFITANANLPVAELQRQIRIDNLAAWCAVVPGLATPADATRAWEELGVHREVSRDGVRFSVPGAAHALQWTVTAGALQRPGTVGVHCTLNVPAPDARSIAAIEAFMAGWATGLEAGVRRLQDERTAKLAAASAPCAPWFG